MEQNDLLGTIAGTLTTISFIPQVWKIWRSRSANDISIGMFILFGLGVTLWLIYGLILQAMPIVLANGVTLLMVLVILIMKAAFKS